MNSTFQVGDVIKQTHQIGAPNRLVVEFTDDPNIVVVWDPDAKTYQKVHTWGHQLVYTATMKTLGEVFDHVTSSIFTETTKRDNW